MNNKTIQLYVLITLLLFGALLGIGYQIRKEIYQTHLNNQPYSAPVQPAEKSANDASVSSTANSQTRKTGQNNASAKQSELLRQQQQLYLDFSTMINALSEGQRPDLQQVSLLITQQQKLVEAQQVSKAEAKAQIDFLIKVLPEMEHELHRALRALD